MANSDQSPSKRLCLSNEEEGQKDIDRISNLPVSVLYNILSFLPTKTSVATSILAKRWADLWTKVPVLSFSSTDARNSSRFVKSVYKVLTQIIRQFSVACKPNIRVDEEYLKTWINAAIRRDVQELKLNLCCQHVRLPGSVFACKTLVSLELYDHVLDAPANVHFPILRILRLERVRYASDDCLSRLLSSCPILEDLTVERVYNDNALVLDISVPSSKGITLLINAPLLERIALKDENYCDFLVEDLLNLVEATIEVFVLCKHEYRVFRFLKEMVALSFCLYQNTPSNNVFHSIPMYHTGGKCGQSLPVSVPKCVSMNLKTLKLTGFFNNECDWKLVRYILKNAKFLKQMKIGISLCLKKRRHLLKNLLKYPRASVACEIGLSFDSSNEEIHL
ncbi:F-box/FBD/LRR-repeat protein At4g26340-like [Durio zibethinus]|uniref:F-box/FBD/LRR-repeat protein At4g26340-like n=1 Tax=Durio zibethinus TaxID=66656 RepID=A0A6P6AB35_DURZI|nr:F-box/FBD/LRR-repeat protein At4g26340-like [Durio zibethinus]